MSPARNLLGFFDRASMVVAAVRALQARKIAVADVYSPIPHEEIVELVASQRPSRVRYVTFMGALAGLSGGLGLALWTSGVWGLVVDGKPIFGLIPFMVVGFEMTILLGALFNLVALLVFARLPHRRFPALAYRPQFSDDRFGVWVAAEPARLQEVKDTLLAAGALEVQEIDAEVDSKEARS
ncbi:MAG TPA: DUF3341 domain-containing protein [Polyangia bacterium]|nr:DUF3341 domain-containing protein [Polyangia bacterium]